MTPLLRKLVPLLLLALPLAGCVGGANEALDAAADSAEAGAAAFDAGAAAAERSANASERAANASQRAPPAPPSPPPSPPPSTETPPAPVEVRVPIDLSGQTGTNVALCPVVGCAGHFESGDRYRDPGLPGVPVAWELTLTWTASTPLSQDLRLGLSRCRGEECEFSYVDGPSPLVLSGTKADLEFAAGDEVEIFVWTASKTPQPVGVYAFADQPFTITGWMKALV